MARMPPAGVYSFLKSSGKVKGHGLPLHSPVQNGFRHESRFHGMQHVKKRLEKYVFMECLTRRLVQFRNCQTQKKIDSSWVSNICLSLVLGSLTGNSINSSFACCLHAEVLNPGEQFLKSPWNNVPAHVGALPATCQRNGQRGIWELQKIRDGLYTFSACFFHQPTDVMT